MAETALRLFATLLFAHFLADFPLQGDFLSKAKNRYAPFVGVPPMMCMFAHVFIQAFGVYIVTGSAFLAMLEFVFHFLIDDSKCSGAITFGQDQLIHILCKLMWTVMLVGGFLPHV